MKRILSMLALLLTYSSASWAVCLPGGTCGPATSYSITLLEVALCQDSACASEYIVGSGSKTFDIASVAVGAAVGSFAELEHVPAGTYTHMRSVVSRTFTISGAAITAANGTCPAQNAAALSVPNGLGAGVQALDAVANAGQAWLTWNDPATKTQIKMIGTLPTPLVISNRRDEHPAVSVAFGTQTALMCANLGPGVVAPVPQPPEVTLTISANR